MYVEIIFFDNIIINFIIVFVSAKIAGAKRRTIRYVLSAAAGAAYAVIAFACFSILQNLLFKIAVSALMCFLAYGKTGTKAFLKNLFVMYTVTMLFGGAVLAARFFFDVSVVPGGIALNSSGFRYTLMGVAVALVLAERLKRMLDDKFESSFIDIKAEICGERICLKGFVDTGNGLIDPITGEGIVIVSKNALQNKLSEKAKKQIFDEQTLWSESSSLKPRLVMFETISGKGSMTAIKPEHMEITVKNKRYASGSYIAITESVLSTEYDAITGTKLRLNEV